MPQKEPMLMVDGLLNVSEDNTAGKCCFTPGLRRTVALNADGSLPGWAMIEVLAQTAAAVLGYGQYKRGIHSSVGLFLAVRGFKAEIDTIPRGRQIITEMKIILDGENCQVVSASAYFSDGKVIAEGRFTLSIPDAETLTKL